MKLIYIAGKYLGEGDWETYNNIHKAREAAVKLWAEGWAVICPHSNSSFMGGAGERDRGNPDGEWRKFLDGDMEIISRCDVIYMLDNWQDSMGAKLELAAAERLGIDVMYE